MNYPHSDELRAPLTRHARAVPCISTGHITKEMGAILLQDARIRERVIPEMETLPLNVFLDHLGSSRNPTGIHGHLIKTAWRESEGLPDSDAWDSLVLLLDDFHQKGYRWIILDRDGDTVEGLPTFDW